MIYQLRMLSPANLDFAAILEWLGNQSVAGANRWVDAFEAACATIAQDPLQQPLAPEDERLGFDVRHMLFATKRGKRYRILFRVVNDEVQILRLRGPGQEILTAQELGIG